jgi:uncharacterized membrane protein SpoIIM required for sporulation
MSDFLTRHKKDWVELESLIRRGRRSVKRLSPEQRERLDVLYRRTTVHLARANSLSDDPALIAYLNGLTASAHSLIFLPPRGRLLGNVVRYFSEGFPRAIARNGREHLLSLVLLLAGAFIGYFAAMSDPMMMHALWGSGDARQPGSTPEQLMHHLRHGRDQGGGEKFLFASFLFQHNLKVGLLAMAAGVLAAVPTVFLMIMNGMILGVFAAIHHQAGIRTEMWAWILPHGITEIGAIVLCGGIGLMLGRAVVSPGLGTRRAALLQAGRESVLIFAGITGMLFAAAIIESYVRQSHMTTTQRLLFAAGTGLFWIAYIGNGFLLERRARQSHSEPSPATTEQLDSVSSQ